MIRLLASCAVLLFCGVGIAHARATAGSPARSYLAATVLLVSLAALLALRDWLTVAAMAGGFLATHWFLEARS